jgi:adenylate kinase family enzyme
MPYVSSSPSIRNITSQWARFCAVPRRFTIKVNSPRIWKRTSRIIFDRRWPVSNGKKNPCAARSFPTLKVYRLDQLRGMDWLEYSTYNGLLIPNHWTEILLEHHIDQLLASNPRSTLILDGYPRTIEAAQHLIAYFKRVSLPILKVIHLSISREEMLRRATIRGREDDSVAAIYRRFEFYVEKVHPSIDYLKEILGSDKVALVDAHQPVYETKANGDKELDVKKSILRICVSSLRALGVPRIVIADLLATYEI